MLMAAVALVSPARGADPTLPDLAPRVRSVFPLGARAGETVEVEFLGRNLDDSIEIAFARKDLRAEVLSSDYFHLKARISVGPGVPTGLHDYRVRTARGTYVGVFHAGSLSAQRELEPNNDLAHAQKIALPNFSQRGTYSPRSACLAYKQATPSARPERDRLGVGALSN